MESNLEKLLAMPIVVAPQKKHSAKVLGSREQWLNSMTPLILEKFYDGTDVSIDWLAKELGSKSANYAAGALQKHKGGADCFCTNFVPVKVRAVIENVPKLLPFLLDEDREALCERLGVDFETLCGKLLELPSVLRVKVVEAEKAARRKLEQAQDDLEYADVTALVDTIDNPIRKKDEAAHGKH